MENQDIAAMIMNQATLGDPIRYANILKASKSRDIDELRKALPKMRETLESMSQISKIASSFRKQISGDGYARRKNVQSKLLGSLDQQKDIFQSYDVDLSLIMATYYEQMTSIYTSIFSGVEMICNARMVTLDETIGSLAEQLENSVDELGGDRTKAILDKVRSANSDALHSLAVEQRVNQGAQTSFAQGLIILERVPKSYTDFLITMSYMFEAYYQKLRNRHSSGMAIVDYLSVPNVSLTDAAILVWDNIDRSGEIEEGNGADEISAFTLSRASAMITSARNETVWAWITDPRGVLEKIGNSSASMAIDIQKFVIRLKTNLNEPTWRVSQNDIEKSLEDFNEMLDSLDLSQIQQRSSDKVFSKTERFAMEHRNESVALIADLLVMGEDISSVVDEILKLKVKSHNFFLNENSFYVCKIGNGNQFAGEAPGAIQVIPGEKPHASLEHIWGGGFQEVRSFIDGMGEAKKWAPLFLSTSPSKSTDKNNVLLVGPQGCGKSELLRALSSQNESISIFAVGSDFLTCWLGEAQKNPKRLFDEAVKLHKSSGKPVHILIDEIDMVLNDDRTSGSRVNLSLEFQNLMDGVVSYPGISIWGATNHPQRIPTPMLRRFAKVMVVGELSEDDRVSIIKHYIEEYLPVSEKISDEQYNLWALKFDGATGDVIRKAVDELWLRLMRSYIHDYEDDAKNVLKFIHENYGDNFEVSQLSAEDRLTIKSMVSDKTSVNPALVDECIAHSLDNFAVQQQIKVARDTYRNSALLLERQKSDKGLGF